MLSYRKSAAICLQLFAFLACTAHGENGTPTAVGPSAKLPTITLTSAVSDTTLNTGQDFTAWLTMTNSSGVQITNLKILEWSAPGSELSRISWTGSGGAQSCSPNAAAPAGASSHADSEITVATSILEANVVVRPTQPGKMTTPAANSLEWHLLTDGCVISQTRSEVYS